MVLIVGWIVVVAFVAQREAEEAAVIGLVAGPFLEVYCGSWSFAGGRAERGVSK